jgi:putative NADH-flavin reductase
MRIVIFGASGPTGRLLTGRALAAGHKVTAVTRRPDSIEEADRLTVVRADVTDAVDMVVEGNDAVVSVLGVPLSRKPVTLYSAGIANILAGMRQHGVRRLVAVSSAVLDPRWRPSDAWFFNNVLDPYVNRKLGRTVHDDMRRMEALIRASDLDWTIVRASGLFSHPEVTEYAVSEDSADGVYTSRTDLAAALLEQLSDDTYVRKAVGVVTTAVQPGIVRLIWREAIRKS